MNLRTVLVVAVLALAATELHADELQVTLSGLATCQAGLGPCNTESPLPFVISYDVDTRSGQQFGPEFGSVGGATVVANFSVLDLAATNYSAVVGGHTVAFAPQTNGDFDFTMVAPDAYDFFFHGGPPGSGFFVDTAAFPVVTAAQFATFNDPLASMLLLYGGAPHGGPPAGISSLGLALLSPNWSLQGEFRVTPVPTPGPLLLFLAGLVGLVVSRQARRRQIESN